MILSTFVGLALGSASALAFGFWVLDPASREMRRGYFNAFVTGLLVAAAVEVIPDALLAVETAVGRLLSGLIPAAPVSETDAMWAMLLHPAQIQIAVRALGAAAVMLIFFRASGTPLVKATPGDEDETEDEDHRRLSPLAIIIFAVAGLACYWLWNGLSGSLPSGTAAGRLSLGVTVVAFSSSFLGIAILGLLDELRRQWWAVLAAAFVIGASTGVGLMWESGRPAIEVGVLPLLIGAFCLIYSIGRMLRLLEGEIGLGWRTTLAVAIGALALYQTRFLL